MIRFSMENPPQLNLDWWKPTQEEWSDVLQKDQKPFWKDEREPSTGRPWAKRKEPTGDWPILNKTGMMQNTMRIHPHLDGFMVATTDYGPYHQFGTSKMTARPWVGIPEKSLRELEAISWKNILS